MKKKLSLAAAAAMVTAALVGAAPAEARPGYCNGTIDYSCTDPYNGYYCTVWYRGCFIGI